jgi:hypothetical protein
MFVHPELHELGAVCVKSGNCVSKRIEHKMQVLVKMSTHTRI